MFLNRCYENDPMVGQDMNPGMNMNMAPNMMGGCCCDCPPVMECPQERVCHTTSCYKVPHIVPINTRIINHQVYHHTYQPFYTTTMEEEISNVYDNNCNF